MTPSAPTDDRRMQSIVKDLSPFHPPGISVSSLDLRAGPLWLLGKRVGPCHPEQKNTARTLTSATDVPPQLAIPK
jgi:hypothetical protein